ncbi:MAG: nucleotidyltransferase domain-containing protein [Coriobacteriales bacterium]|jgi:predicted nucleotidyltransferase|nr:nucleotidyltransferase domain-containing protein [Coriobacteriales bacterium]
MAKTGNAILEHYEWYSNIESKISLIRDIIVHALPVERLYLFGSYVDGGFSSDRESDLDFFVVLEDSYSRSPHEALVEMEHVLWEDSRWGLNASYIPTDFLAQKSSRFNEMAKVTTLEQKVFRDGRLVYDKRL